MKRALASAGVPSVLEPVGLDRGDGRRPDGLTLFPYTQGKSLIWDATCTDTYAGDSIVACAADPGAAARAAEARKRRRYEDLAQRYRFEPLAVETTGVLGPAFANFITDLGRRVAVATGDISQRDRLAAAASISCCTARQQHLLANLVVVFPFLILGIFFCYM